MGKVALVDFDGTIVEHKFPKIGKPLPEAFEVLKDMKEAGWKLILWTCRENSPSNRVSEQYLREAVDFCKKNGVEFDAVNEGIPEEDFRPDDCLKRKPHVQYVIDDRNLGGFPGWPVVREVVLGNKDLVWSVE